MKKRTLTLLTILVLSLLIVTGCSKDDDNNPAPKTKTELLTTSTWRFSSATISGADASGMLEACKKDNVYTFAAAGTGTFDEGATKCNGADPQTGNFTWSFLSGETILQISADLFGATGNPTITTLSETQLVLTMVVDLGGPQTVVVTFIH